MKYLLLALIALLSTLKPIELSVKQENNYESDIELWQNELNSDFKDKDHSPLTEEGYNIFVGLYFYKVSQKLNIKAKFVLTPFEPVFEMPTTTSRLPKYRKFGIASFIIDGNEYELSVYQNQELIYKKGYEDYLFIPYTDLTSGNTSYAGGRYIDVRIPKKDVLIIDFNKSYNPYCAYNHKYSCPIPPRENHLNTRVEAGVMAYNDLTNKSHK
jgi:uncharacterized protein (DUF1684 family)